jgi:purine nucleosidase
VVHAPGPDPVDAAHPATRLWQLGTLADVVRIHLDTDIGGDIDDLQALAYMLASPAVEITGITTAAEQGGRRAGYVHRVLQLAGRTDIPVAAGIDVDSGRFRCLPAYPSDDTYWGGPVPPAPGPAEEALALLRRSLEARATVVCIGPWTNVARLEEGAPGTLSQAALVLLGTFLTPPPMGYLSWGPEMDWNVQLDQAAARTVLEASTPLILPLGPCLETPLQRRHVVRLREAGPLGQLLARQAQQFDADYGNADKWARQTSLTPADTINFLYDPLACGIATGWHRGLRIESLYVAVGAIGDEVVQGGTDTGRLANVVMQVDGPAFSEAWIGRITEARI